MQIYFIVFDLDKECKEGLVNDEGFEDSSKDSMLIIEIIRMQWRKNK